MLVSFRNRRKEMVGNVRFPGLVDLLAGKFARFRNLPYQLYSVIGRRMGSAKSASDKPKVKPSWDWLPAANRAMCVHVEG